MQNFSVNCFLCFCVERFFHLWLLSRFFKIFDFPQLATHSSILAWELQWTEESMGSHRVRHDWVIVTLTHFLQFIYDLPRCVVIWAFIPLCVLSFLICSLVLTLIYRNSWLSFLHILLLFHFLSLLLVVPLHVYYIFFVVVPWYLDILFCVSQSLFSFSFWRFLMRDPLVQGFFPQLFASTPSETFSISLLVFFF